MRQSGTCRDTLPLRNATSYADRRGSGCPSARAMQVSGTAGGPASSAVGQDSRACKYQRSNVDVVHETVPAGVTQQRLMLLESAGPDYSLHAARGRGRTAPLPG